MPVLAHKGRWARAPFPFKVVNLALPNISLKDDPEIHFKIALEYWYLQDIPMTAESYRKVIEIKPDHLQAHLNLASVYERQKDWQNAIKEIEIAKRLGKESGDEQSISIAESKMALINGGMNLSKQDMKQRLNPPFN